MRKPKVSVIVPVYNGEDFLERTIRSLKDQNFEDFEVLLIDDQSMDSSLKIIKAISEIDPRFKCLQTPQNLGIVPKVMNFAREHIAGEFFVYSSQDDFFSYDWLSKMVARAEETGADAVLPDLVVSTGFDATDRKIIGINGDRDSIIDGKTAFALSLDWTIPGNALWRTKFILEIGYFDFGMYADEYTARYFFLKCHSVAFCDGIFYYFQGNPNAITKAVSPKRLDAAYNNFRLYKLALESGIEPEFISKCCQRAAYSLIQCAVATVRHAHLKKHSDKLKTAIECMKDPEFLRQLRISLRKDWLLQFVIPAAIKFRPLLYCVAVLIVAFRR